MTEGVMKPGTSAVENITWNRLEFISYKIKGRIVPPIMVNGVSTRLMIWLSWIRWQVSTPLQRSALSNVRHIYGYLWALSKDNCVKSTKLVMANSTLNKSLYLYLKANTDSWGQIFLRLVLVRQRYLGNYGSKRAIWGTLAAAKG